jgi:hypothetical protein
MKYTHTHTLSLSAIFTPYCKSQHKQVHLTEIGFADVGRPVGVSVGVFVVGICLPRV